MNHYPIIAANWCIENTINIFLVWHRMERVQIENHQFSRTVSVISQFISELCVRRYTHYLNSGCLDLLSVDSLDLAQVSLH